MRVAATIIGGGLAALFSLGVFFRERGYYNAHPYARGPSGMITVLALCVAVIGVLTVWRAIEDYNAKHEADQRWLREQQAKLRGGGESG